MTTVDYLSAINQGGSGLNITQIVDSLVDAEKTPQENAIQTKIDDKTTSISAIGEVKSALSVLSSSLSNLVGKTSLSVSSNSSAVSASITDPSSAKSLNSAMTISSLAAGQTLAFTGYSATTDIVGGGSLVLRKRRLVKWQLCSKFNNSINILDCNRNRYTCFIRDKINAFKLWCYC